MYPKLGTPDLNRCINDPVQASILILTNKWPKTALTKAARQKTSYIQMLLFQPPVVDSEKIYLTLKGANCFSLIKKSFAY